MGSEWVQYSLGDITTWTSGGTPSKSKDEYWNGDIPWISASSMDGNRYNDSKLKITDLGLENGSRLALKDSILLLVRGSILHQKVQVGIALRNVAFNQDVKALKVNTDVVEPWYLLFWFMANREKILGLVESTGIGAGKLDTTILQNLTVDVPPKEYRHQLLAFVKALDDKIELNRQINTTLESMAQALFKSWFVDFDPVIDNALAVGNPIPEPLQARADKRAALLAAASAAGTRSASATDNAHPTQTAPHTQPGTTAPATPLQPLPADLRALFPDSFVFNEEMGWVPEGWAVGSLDEISRYGTDRISVDEIEHKNYVSTENLIPERGGVREASSLPTSEWVPAFTDGSILVSNIRPYFKKIWLARGAGGRSNDVLGFESKLAGAEEYLYCLLYQDKFFDYKMATAKGTKMPRGDKKAIMNWQVVIPSPQLVREFSSMIRGFFLSVQARSEQSLSLASIRDLILPRLLRGEIRIEDVNQSLAEVV